MSSFQGTGHRLTNTTNSAADDANTNANVLTPSQLRERRLAAMTKNSSPNKRTTSAAATPTESTGNQGSSAGPWKNPPTKTSSTSTPPAKTARPNPQDISPALSTQTPQQPTLSPNINTSSISQSSPKSQSTQSSIYIQQEPLSNCFLKSFHNLMWDSHNANMTQKAEDQDRWFRQGIHTPALLSMEQTSNTTKAQDKHDFLAAKDLWGLTQHHGGPCGVLAAVQAEMIRVLWMQKSSSSNNTVDGTDGDGGHDHDTAPSDNDDKKKVASTIKDKAADPMGSITLDQVQRALAMAMGRILARCAIMPSISAKSDGQSTGSGSTLIPAVKLVLPAMEDDTETDNMNISQEDAAMHQETKEEAKQEDRQRNGTAVLSWEDINVPFAVSTDETKSSTKLKCVTIRGSPINLSGLTGDDTYQQQQIQTDAIDQLGMATGNYLYQQTCIPHFYHQGGVLLFTMSCVACRTVEIIRTDMDDINSNFTSSFGHCSQELMNLLLTGQAVSNVFDNTMTLGTEGSPDATAGDGIVVTGQEDILSCHGITYQPDIGYLSQLESLRYCSVGTYYKSPTCPIWVIGSTSHFTILFSLDESCLEECQSDMLLDKCRRAFKSISDGDENGFISVSSLADVIRLLDSDSGDVRNKKWSGTIHKIGVENAQALGAYLEVSGCGIILWEEFWKATSRLLTGASLESVLQGPTGESSATTTTKAVGFEKGDSDSPPPLLITQYGEEEKQPIDSTGSNVVSAPASAVASYSGNGAVVESDEELAKRLAAEWGTDQNLWNGASNSSSTAATTATATTTTTTGTSITGALATTESASGAFKSDEQLARELQDQWNNDATYIGPSLMDIDMADSSVAAQAEASDINNDFDAAADAEVARIISASDHIGADSKIDTPIHTDSREDELKQPATKPSNTVVNNETKLNFEKYDDSFVFHHYNGLRGGVLTSFRITRLSSEEAVGSSVALTSTARDTLMVDSALSGASGSSGGKSDLEDVMRTKYQSCLFDWGGQLPPYID